ncbi:MAG TPA: hypothetical protein ENK45_03580 [Aliiroseovarius sp.]|nr:hypothetical protein [Aliiroseovarius sp.]
MRKFFAALLMMIALPAQAQEDVVAGLSQNRISINATFVGSEILIFGAVKRDAPAPDTGDLAVIIVVEGPSGPITVRRKEKRYGIWINTQSVTVEAAPSFYAVATSAPMEQALAREEDLKYHITIPQEIRLAAGEEDLAEFAEAVIRIRKDQGLYNINEGGVRLNQDTLFDTSVSLPSNLTEGDYRARIFLTRDGRVVANYDTAITVRKVGLERWIYTLAHEKPLVYGIMALVIAILAGWGASTFFQVVLRKT